jgi:hypothetical protein
MARYVRPDGFSALVRRAITKMVTRHDVR